MAYKNSKLCERYKNVIKTVNYVNISDDDDNVKFI